MPDEVGPSRFDDGVHIAANGDVKIDLNIANENSGSGINLLDQDKGKSKSSIPAGVKLAITAAAWERLCEAVTRRQDGGPASS